MAKHSIAWMPGEGIRSDLCAGRVSGPGFGQPRRLTIRYDEVLVGALIADTVVENMLLMEVKAVRAIDPALAAQCINSMTATRIAACRLFNFGTRVEVKPFINSKNLKRTASSHLRSSASSAAIPTSSATPMTWAEKAEWDEP